MGGGNKESRADKRERKLQRRMAELERRSAAQRNARTLSSDIFSIYGTQPPGAASGASGTRRFGPSLFGLVG